MTSLYGGQESSPKGGIAIGRMKKKKYSVKMGKEKNFPEM